MTADTGRRTAYLTAVIPVRDGLLVALRVAA